MKIVAVLVTSFLLVAACGAKGAESAVTQTVAPSTSAQPDPGLALVAAACLVDDDSDPLGISWQPNYWMGILVNQEIDEDRMDRMELENNKVLKQAVQRTDFIEQAFESAASIDPRWEPILDLWDRGSAAVLKQYRARAEYPLFGANRYSNKLTAQCKVALSEASMKAQDSGMSIAEWVAVNAGDMLPQTP